MSIEANRADRGRTGTLRIGGGSAFLFAVVAAVIACEAPSTGSTPKGTEIGDDDDIAIPQADDDDDTTPPKPKTTRPKVDAGTSSSSSGTSTGSCKNADSDLCLACCLDKNPDATAFEEAYSSCLNGGGDPEACKTEHLAQCAGDPACVANHACMKTAGCIIVNGCE